MTDMQATVSVNQVDAEWAAIKDGALAAALLALCFAASILGFMSASKILGGPLVPFARPIRYLSGATFTIYLLHRPIVERSCTRHRAWWTLR